MCACHKNHIVGCIKNESNCLLENKMVSTLIWRNVILLYVVQSNILWLTLQCDYSNQGHLTKFSTNLTTKYRGL